MYLDSYPSLISVAMTNTQKEKLKNQQHDKEFIRPNSKLHSIISGKSSLSYQPTVKSLLPSVSFLLSYTVQGCCLGNGAAYCGTCFPAAMNSQSMPTGWLELDSSSLRLSSSLLYLCQVDSDTNQHNYNFPGQKEVKHGEFSEAPARN